MFDADTNRHVGSFYLDMLPRAGKYGHAGKSPLSSFFLLLRDAQRVNSTAVFSLQPATVVPTSVGLTADPPAQSFLKEQVAPRGKWQPPIAAMVCNFTLPTPEKPSLLTHDEVNTFFHEFGHVMHQICSEARSSRFSGTRVERDFVEAPSQMLENWTWRTETLQKLSGLYSNPEQKVHLLVVVVALLLLVKVGFANSFPKSWRRRSRTRSWPTSPCSTSDNSSLDSLIRPSIRDPLPTLR